MGWRHDHLKDAYGKIAHGDVQGARKIVVERKDECGTAFAKIANIKLAIQAYEESLTALERMLSENMNHRANHSVKELQEKMGIAMHNLMMLRADAKAFVECEEKIE